MATGRILVVDDDEDSRYLMTMLVEMEGFRAARATNGYEALLVARATRPQLVLLDLMMPSANGPWFIERLRADPALRAIPVALVTAMSQHQAARTFGSLAVDAHLQKPFQPDDLVEMIWRLNAKTHSHDQTADQ